MKRYLLYFIFNLSLCFLLVSCGDWNPSHKGGSNNSSGNSSSGELIQMGGALQGSQIFLAGQVTTIAGTAQHIGSTDGPAALFDQPNGITTDGKNLYIADTYNHTIRQIVIGTQAVTTIAGSAGQSGSIDGTGSGARFNFPKDITTDGTNLFVADTGNFTIRKVVISTGEVTTIAGSAGQTGSTDGTGSAARFNGLAGITTDGMNLFVTDTANDTIRQIVIGTYVVTTLAGSAGNIGSTDAVGSAARFNFPAGITTDKTNLYVADADNFTIRKIVISTGGVTTLAGSAGQSGSIDGSGPAALFNRPVGITSDGTSLYITDTGNNTARKIVISTGGVTTIAGSAGKTGSTDGSGSAALFNGPAGITTDGIKLYLADMNNSTIRQIQ